MDISICFPSTHQRTRRLQYANPRRWTPDQEANYLRFRASIPYNNLDIAAGFLRLARTVSPTLAVAYRAKAGQISHGRRFSRKDYYLVLPFLATHARFTASSNEAKPASQKDLADYAKVAPSKIPPEQLRPAGFRKVSR